MLLAGQETTALALTWSWYLIGQHPEVDARLGAEVEAVLGGRAATIDDLPRLRYTGQIVTEAMRLFPPAWALGREVAVDCEVGGTRCPRAPPSSSAPGSCIAPRASSTSPAAFRPERWEGSLAKDLPRFAYLPFGGGPRICIGNRFALMEASLVLATVAQRFSLAWQSSRPVVPLPSITLRPDGGVWVKLASRACRRPLGVDRRGACFQA